jgi:hypothetical protein
MFYGTLTLAAVQLALLGYVIYQQRKQEKIIMATKADSDLAAEVVASLSAQLSALNSEDPAVAAIAADIEARVLALQNAFAPLPAA